MVFLLAGLCIANVALLLFAEKKGADRLKTAAKLAASASFVGVALLSGALNTGLGQWILVGLTLSFLGDALLLSDKRLLFLGGMGAFGAAHLAYLVGFVVGSTPWSDNWPAGAGAVAILCAFALRWLHPQLLPQWRVPTLIYGLIIGAMAVTAAIGVAAGSLPHAFLIAALMFAISDISVARDRLTGTKRGSHVWGLPLYYAAQMVFALSV